MSSDDIVIIVNNNMYVCLYMYVYLILITLSSLKTTNYVFILVYL